MRAVFEALGISDVITKSIGTSNPHNMIKATFSALGSMMSPRAVAAKRGKKIGDIVGRREGGETGGAGVMADHRSAKLRVTQIGSPIGRHGGSAQI